MRILSILGSIVTVFPAVAVKPLKRGSVGPERMRSWMRITFALMVVPVMLWAPPSTLADAEPRSALELPLLLSTDIGESEGERGVGEAPADNAVRTAPAVREVPVIQEAPAVREAPVVREAMAQTATADTGSDPADRYRIDSGDGISITVYGEPDLSIKDERVKGNGKISYPLLGEIEVRGRTASELQRTITRMLADGYLKKPNVTVSIDTFRLFYIKGEVRNPGGFNYVDGLTVEKAVALAGGYTERASKRNITVVREGDPDQRVRQATPGTSIRPGDVITIGESFF